MHLQNPLRVGISASLRAAGLIIGTAIFVGACTGESDSANGQTGSNQVNQRAAPPQANAARRAGNELLRGVAAKGDWTTDGPGVRRKLTPADLPAPYATDSVFNQPNEISQPQGAMPQVPAGFRVEKFADRLTNPHMILSAPNGDLFVTESEADRIRLLRDANGDGTARYSPPAWTSRSASRSIRSARIRIMFT